MRTIVISDLHLTNHFDVPKYELLKKLVKSCDQVIINGDLWEAYRVSFEQFLQSQWQQLFPLLKQKQCIYLFGNHDRAEWVTKAANEFSIFQGEYYQISNQNNIFHIEHGNKIAPAMNDKYPFIPRYSIVGSVARGRYKLGQKMHGPKFFEKNRYKNNLMKDWVKKLQVPDLIFIASHTHLPEFSPDEQYINTGYIENGFASYVLITDTSVELRQENYA